MYKIRHTVNYYAKIYKRIIGVYIKTRFGYRIDFLVGFIGILIKSFSGILTLSVIFSNIPQIAGWTFYDLLFFYGLSSMAFIPIELFMSNVWSLHNHIIQGTFIKYCLKPLNTMFYYFSEVFEIKAVMQLFVSIPITLYATHKIGIVWNVERVMICVAYFCCSTVIIGAIYIMSASLGFWMKNSISIINFVGQLMRFSQYPLTIYGSVFRFIFSYIVPIGFISYYPAMAITGRVSYIKLLEVFLIAIVFSVLSVFIWKKGVKNYSGTGS